MASALIYLHGFNSSPQSQKAQIIRTWCQKNRPDIHIETPQLACYPEQAAQQLLELARKHQYVDQVGLIGSSLGGYLATWLNTEFNYPAVLVNPAVKPYDLLKDYLGHQQNPYTDEIYFLEPHHMDELKALDTITITNPASFWLLQQKGDETLDYRQAVKKYRECKQTLEPDGNHAFVGFDRFTADIIQFLAL